MMSKSREKRGAFRLPVQREQRVDQKRKRQGEMQAADHVACLRNVRGSDPRDTQARRLQVGLDEQRHVVEHRRDERGEDAIQNYRKGEVVQAVVQEVDTEKERISLSVKALDDSFTEVVDGVKRGSVVTVVVTSIEDGGIEVEYEGMKSFIRRSDLSRDRAEQRPERFSVGDKVDVRVTNVDSKTRRLGLSIKAREIAEEKEAVQQYGSSDSGASLGEILGAIEKLLHGSELAKELLRGLGTDPRHTGQGCQILVGDGRLGHAKSPEGARGRPVGVYGGRGVQDMGHMIRTGRMHRDAVGNGFGAGGDGALDLPHAPARAHDLRACDRPSASRPGVLRRLRAAVHRPGGAPGASARDPHRHLHDAGRLRPG